MSAKGYTGTLKGINGYSGVYGGEKGIHGYISTLQAVPGTLCVKDIVWYPDMGCMRLSFDDCGLKDLYFTLYSRRPGIQYFVFVSW